jgi:hypothetical protein
MSLGQSGAKAQTKPSQPNRKPDQNACSDRREQTKQEPGSLVSQTYPKSPLAAHCKQRFLEQPDFLLT